MLGAPRGSPSALKASARITRMSVLIRRPRTCTKGTLKTPNVVTGQIFVDRGNDAKETIEMYIPLKNATGRRHRICPRTLLGSHVPEVRSLEARAEPAVLEVNPESPLISSGGLVACQIYLDTGVCTLPIVQEKAND
ncbi:MAG: hypothetical protein Q9211_006320 [Gyalolechia sp. 1 TL-2023]